VSVECLFVVVWSRAGRSSWVRKFFKSSLDQLGQFPDFKNSDVVRVGRVGSEHVQAV
jgi:hypothetical protein